MKKIDLVLHLEGFEDNDGKHFRYRKGYTERYQVDFDIGTEGLALVRRVVRLSSKPPTTPPPEETDAILKEIKNLLNLYRKDIEELKDTEILISGIDCG